MVAVLLILPAGRLQSYIAYLCKTIEQSEDNPMPSSACHAGCGNLDSYDQMENGQFSRGVGFFFFSALAGYINFCQRY